MRIGLALPHYDFSFPDPGPVSWARLRDAALRAESLGFDSVWLSDHFFLDLARYGGPDEPQGSLEPFTAVAALAAVTERVRLGTLVTCAPFRAAGQVAKMATAIDLASGGRFDLGIGAGWYEREFEAFGYPFPEIGERFSMLEEQVAAVRALFDGGPVDFDGRHVRLRGAYNHPAPATPGGPPIWVGGKGGDRLLRLVARHAAGWNTVWRWTPQDHAARAARLREIAEREGRDPASVRLSVGLYTLVGEDERDLVARFRAMQRWMPGGALDGALLEDFGRDTLTGTPDACLNRLGGFAAHGVEEVVVGAGPLPFSVFDWEMVELVAETLLPRARALS